MIGEKASKGLRPFPPQRFGRYTLLAPLASGGMGEVFLGRLEGAEGFEKLVVIKKILPQLAQEQDFVDRFVTEAKVLVKLHHGSVAQVLDMGTIDGDYYIALEFVDGKDLRKVAARCKERGHTVPLGLTLFVMMRVLDALAYAHRKKGDDEKDLNLVHRDVSPQNVLISYEGEVKVIDFGLAKSSLSLGRTNPSVILGKFFYMSPEQAKHGKVDRRSDLYAAGICLYELIAGKNPFEGLPQGELMNKVANPTIEPLGLAMPGVPPSVEQVVMRALAPDPKDRFNSAEEMRGRVMAAMLELDPGAGPESLAHFMRAIFTNEYGQERRVFQGLRDQAGSSRSADAKTGAMPALRLADDGEPSRPSAATLPGFGGTAQLTPATAETHVGPRKTAAAITGPTLVPSDARPESGAFELPTGRSAEATRPSAPDELPASARRATDPARSALDLDALPGLAESEPAARLAAPTGASSYRFTQPMQAYSADDPQEFQLPGHEEQPGPPVADEQPVLSADPLPADDGDGLSGPTVPGTLQLPDEDPPTAPIPPVLTPSSPSMKAAPRSTAAAAQRPAPAARPPAPAVDLPKVMVAAELQADDKGAPAGERIENMSTRPLMGTAKEAHLRGRTGDRPQRIPQKTPAAPATVAPPPEKARAPTVVINPPPKAAAVPAAAPGPSARTSLFIGLAIGAGVVLLAVLVLLAVTLLK